MAVQFRSGKTCMTPTVAQEVHRAQQRTKKLAAKGTHDSAIIVETAHFYTAHIQALQHQQSDLASELQAAEDAYADPSKNYEQLNTMYDELREMYDELKLHADRLEQEVAAAFEGYFCN
ncbi:hypothetical protein PHYSODRAFT_248267 [Phytophthora sojae]|uniref:Uncharacterized protein n=1 Tax=Phytophthora sojae (strain P6497) TaxID=1094619 RepID=G4YGJ3_PHYSP|nr:hypothetical protein PHYSODRAFT_248267 [Phytophthora sojae]EGZ26528.1 hypothetical protein PHYSODRAFT_248267 [Phytophthora sojae]|eukprot:XP_009513803.1 hypothetical protein PHYSODRAFT_248267 [Phytophthora sojae]